MERFNALYDTHKNYIYAICYRVLGDIFLAEDATQEALVRVFKNIDKVDEIDSLKTKRFIMVIAKSAAIDLYRKQKKRNSYEFDMESITSDIGYLPDYEGDSGVFEVMSKIPDKYRDVLILKYSSGYENSEIAQILGILEGTVRQRLSRGKKLLEKMMISEEGQL